jgi:hypothetical protein
MSSFRSLYFFSISEDYMPSESGKISLRYVNIFIPMLCLFFCRNKFFYALLKGHTPPYIHVQIFVMLTEKKEFVDKNLCRDDLKSKVLRKNTVPFKYKCELKFELFVSVSFLFSI